MLYLALIQEHAQLIFHAQLSVLTISHAISSPVIHFASSCRRIRHCSIFQSATKRTTTASALPQRVVPSKMIEIFLPSISDLISLVYLSNTKGIRQRIPRSSAKLKACFSNTERKCLSLLSGKSFTSWTNLLIVVRECLDNVV